MTQGSLASQPAIEGASPKGETASHPSIGVLRPNITLYGDYDKLGISKVVEKDLLKRSPPDYVLIAGTRR